MKFRDSLLRDPLPAVFGAVINSVAIESRCVCSSYGSGNIGPANRVRFYRSQIST